MEVRPDNPRVLSRRDALVFFGKSSLAALLLAACGGKVPGAAPSPTTRPASAPTSEPTHPKPPRQIPATGGENLSATATEYVPAKQPTPIPSAEAPIPSGSEYPTYSTVLDSNPLGSGGGLPEALSNSPSYTDGFQKVKLGLNNHNIDESKIRISAITNGELADGNKFRWILTAEDIKTGEFLWIQDQNGNYSDKPLQNPGDGSAYEFTRMSAKPEGLIQQVEWFGEWPILVRRNNKGEAISLFDQTFGEWIYTPKLSTEIQEQVIKEYLSATDQSDLASVLEAFKLNPKYKKQKTDGFYGFTNNPNQYDTDIYHCPSLMLGMQYHSVDGIPGVEPGDVGVRLLFTTTDDFLDPTTTINSITGEQFKMYPIEFGIIRKGILLPFCEIQKFLSKSEAHKLSIEKKSDVINTISEELYSVRKFGVNAASVWRPNITVRYEKPDFESNRLWRLNWQIVLPMQKNSEGYIARNTKEYSSSKKIRVNLRYILESLRPNEPGLYSSAIWMI